MCNQSQPKTLIKYYECNELNNDALDKNYLWASNPKQFNDPFDCSMAAWDKNSFSDEIFKRIIHPEFYRDLGHILLNNPRDQYLKFIQLFIGIICLNKYIEKNEDLLWGYYNQQKGFSVEFNTNMLSKSLNRSLEEVQYREPSQFKIFDVPKEIINGSEMFPILTEWIKQKKRIWENESEWRCIFFDCNYDPCSGYGKIETRKKIYSLDSINGITLGFKFFDGCFLEKTEKGFKYNISKDGNKKEKKKLLSFIKRNQVAVHWINLFNLKLVRIPIEIETINCKSIFFSYH